MPVPRCPPCRPGRRTAASDHALRSADARHRCNDPHRSADGGADLGQPTARDSIRLIPIMPAPVRPSSSPVIDVHGLPRARIVLGSWHIPAGLSLSWLLLSPGLMGFGGSGGLDFAILLVAARCPMPGGKATCFTDFGGGLSAERGCEARRRERGRERRTQPSRHGDRGGRARP